MTEFFRAAETFQGNARQAKDLLLQALAAPERAQQLVLEDLSRVTALASHWRSGGADLSTLDTLRRTVPVNGYPGFEDALESETITKGGILTTSPVLRWLKTSGTTGRPKLIPYTQHWMRRYRVPAMLAMWDTFLAACPEILLHEAATLDTQTIREQVEPTVHGLSHQAISNRHPQVDRFDWNPPWYNEPWYGPQVPSSHEGRSYYRLRYFLGRDLRALTAINPSLILSLRDTLRGSAEALLRDLHDGTIEGRPSLLAPQAAEARRLEAVLARPSFTFRDVWPRLGFSSCWAAAGAEAYLTRLQELMPRTTFVPFMTCGTEGVVTIPVSAQLDAQPLALNQAVYEFVPVTRDPAEWLGRCETGTLAPGEVEAGRRYHLVMSQGNGLLRLWTGDVFEVVEVRHGVPWLRFVERYGIFHSFTGEKLTHTDVATAFARTYAEVEGEMLPYLIGPEWGEVPRYVVLVESRCEASADRFERTLDRVLANVNIEYASKRSSGRLRPPLVRVCPPDTLRLWLEGRRSTTNQNQFKFASHRKSAEFFHELSEVRS
ncbi:MAG: hypothetical protein QG608_1105 [Actinomycetota bacterium]|nr:hypothetical protein [Actinomycetota bacterium]